LKQDQKPPASTSESKLTDKKSSSSDKKQQSGHHYKGNSRSSNQSKKDQKSVQEVPGVIGHHPPDRSVQGKGAPSVIGHHPLYKPNQSQGGSRKQSSSFQKLDSNKNKHFHNQGPPSFDEIVGDSSSQSFPFEPKKRSREQNDSFFPSQSDRRRPHGEDFKNKYYSRDVDLSNLEDEIEKAKPSITTPRAEVAKDKMMIVVGGPLCVNRVQDSPPDGLFPVGLVDLVIFCYFHLSTISFKLLIINNLNIKVCTEGVCE
jgi:hypothetical protein